MLNLYGKTFSSRLLIGSALYPSPAIMQAAIRASGAQIVTVSLRRESAGGKTGDAFWSLIRELDVTVLPNTAGCRSVREAVTTAKLARELFATSWIKLEVIADNDTLQPDVVGLVEAASILIKDGFEVFPYCTEDLSVATRLVEAGCKVVMPWAAPIGSAKGVINRGCAEAAARPPSRYHAGGRCRFGRAVPCGAGAGAGLRRRTAQHGDCKSRRSRRDGVCLQARRRSRTHRLRSGADGSPRFRLSFHSSHRDPVLACRILIATRILIAFILWSTASRGSRGWPRSASARCNCAPRTSTIPEALQIVSDALAVIKRHQHKTGGE